MEGLVTAMKDFWVLIARRNLHALRILQLMNQHATVRDHAMLVNALAMKDSWVLNARRNLHALRILQLMKQHATVRDHALLVNVLAIKDSWVLNARRNLNVRRTLIAVVKHVMQVQVYVIAQQTQSTILTIAAVGICFLVWKGCLFHDLTTAQAKSNVSKD